MYYLIYNWDTVDNEVNYDYYSEKRKLLYSECVISDWEDENDVIATGIDIAKSHNYYPIAIIDSVDDIQDTIKQAMSELGKRSWQSRKETQNMSELAKKRWNK